MSDPVSPHQLSVSDPTPNHPLWRRLARTPTKSRRLSSEEIGEMSHEQLFEDYHPTRPWQHHAISTEQQSYLARLGFSNVKHLTKGQAGFLIDLILDGEPTWNQKETLTRRGKWREGLTRREAMDLCAEGGNIWTGW